jgi:hypothetical protein
MSHPLVWGGRMSHPLVWGSLCNRLFYLEWLSEPLLLLGVAMRATRPFEVVNPLCGSESHVLSFFFIYLFFALLFFFFFFFCI